MRFVTLTTDYGTKDYYASIVKAKLLDLETNEPFNLLDITHEIPAFDRQVAAYQINAWQAKVGFNAIHMIGVGPSAKHWLTAMDRGAFYVMPDNGIISLLDLTEQKQVYQFKEPLFPSSFDDIAVFVSALEGILNQEEGLTKSENWIETDSFVQTRWINPIVEENPEISESGMVYGQIIHFDNYGNGITNINLKELSPKVDLKKMRVELPHREIVGVHKTYSDLLDKPKAECFALFNSQDMLEIGINESSSKSGGVKELLGISKGLAVKLIY